MEAIKELKDEHQAVKLSLEILKKISARLSEGEDVDLTHLDQLLDFLRTFVDKCHHGKEEDLLFPAMANKGIPQENGPIGVMLREHDLGRKYIRGISEGLERLKAGDKEAASQVIDNINNYSNLLSQHIDKEDNVLYPMAERIISNDEMGELLEGFERIEQERIGEGRHEAFHHMLHSLKKVYLE